MIAGSMFELKEVHRQKDPVLVSALNGLRLGNISNDLRSMVRECSKPLSEANGIMPTRLYATNKSVNQENEIQLNKLPGSITQWQCVDSTTNLRYGQDEQVVDFIRQFLDKECPAEKVLQLKVGAQVMLNRNLNDSWLFNGARGVIVGFKPVSSVEIVRESGAFSKVPHEVLRKFMLLPEVLFETGTKRIMYPQEFPVTIGSKKHARWQVPLKLAWALTIHKAQGATLDKVECHLQNIFSEGQVYVALSRCRTKQGLRIVGFDERKVRANGEVLKFHKKLQKKSH